MDTTQVMVDGTVDAHGSLSVTGGVEELFRVLLSEHTLAEVLDRVAHLARSMLPEADEVSVTVIQDGRPSSVVFTGDLAVHLDERQYEAGFGPCLDAASTGQVVMIRDTSDETAYADFARAAMRVGVTRSLSVGMPVPGRTVGGLNIYGRVETGFDEQTLVVAQGFAAHAAVAIANAALYASTAAQVEQLRQAMASRSTIEQAKGMVMAARRCTADEAFAELSRMSAQANRKVRDVAEDIVARRGEGL